MKITSEINKKMIAMREEGASYNQIVSALGVSKWACRQYLGDVIVDPSWVEEAWKKAEEEAATLLIEHGFTDLLNLNLICPQATWDYYAKKDNNWWLIDVTVNNSKDIGRKITQMIDGIRAAILLKKEGSWAFFEVTKKELWGKTTK